MWEKTYCICLVYFTAHDDLQFPHFPANDPICSLCLNNILWYMYTTFSLSTHLFMGT
jgi:hypothetical protein